MGSLTGYRGRGLGKAFLGAGSGACGTRVELQAREDNLRALALLKTSMPQTGRAEEQTRRVQIFAAFDLIE